MRHFQNSVLDFKLPVESDYVSAPLETAWASEAIFFLRIEPGTKGEFRFAPRAEISVDGISWLAEGSVFSPISQAGQYFLRVRHFGGWLRLAGSVEPSAGYLTFTVNLVLKE
jgi:hypothetical protein